MRFFPALVLSFVLTSFAGCTESLQPSMEPIPAASSVVGQRLHSFKAQYASGDGLTIDLALSAARLIADHDLSLRRAWPLDVTPRDGERSEVGIAIRYWLDSNLDVVRIETGRCPIDSISSSCNAETQILFAYWAVQGSLPPFGLDLPFKSNADASVAYSLNGRPASSAVEKAEVSGTIRLRIPEGAPSAELAFLSHGATYEYASPTDWLPTKISNLHYYAFEKIPSPPLPELSLVNYENGVELPAIDPWPKLSVTVRGEYEPIYKGQDEAFYNPNYTTAEGLSFLLQSSEEVRQDLEQGGCIRFHALSASGSGSLMGVVTNTQDVLIYIVEKPTGELLEWRVVRDLSLGLLEQYSLSPSSPETYATEADIGSCLDLQGLPALVTTGADFWEAAKTLPIQSQEYELSSFSYGSLRLGLLPASGTDAAQSYSAVYFPPGGGFSMIATMYGSTGRWSEMLIREGDLDAIDRGERLTI